MTLQEQIEVVMENIDTPIANSGSLQIARQIIRKQAEALKVAKKGMSEVTLKIIEQVGERIGKMYDTYRIAEKALAAIEEMEK